MGVVAPEVREEQGDFAYAAESEVAPLVRGAPVLPRYMVMVPDLVGVVGVEGLVAHLAVGLVGVIEGELVLPLQALLILVERHCLLLEVPQLNDKPLHTVLPHRRLVPDVELGEC